MLLSNLHESDFHICDSYVKRKHSVWSVWSKAKKHPHQGLSKCHHSSISSWISSSDSLRHQPNPLVTLNVVQRRRTHCTSTLRHIISVYICHYLSYHMSVLTTAPVLISSAVSSTDGATAFTWYFRSSS